MVLPPCGRLSAHRQQHERQPWFRRGVRYRVGIEGRIGMLKRDYGLGRCRDPGERNIGRSVGRGIVTANLAAVARAVAARLAARRYRLIVQSAWRISPRW